MNQSQSDCKTDLLWRGLLISFFLLIYSAPCQAALHPRGALPEYRLQVSFDLPRGKVLGRATILAPQGQKLTIDPGNLAIKEIRSRGEKIAWGGRPGKNIVLVSQGPIQIDYEVHLKKTGDIAMDQRGLILLSEWYPLVEGFCRYKLTATLPSGYLAVSEADRVTHTEKDGQAEFVFDFPHPLHEQDGITLSASNLWVVVRENHNNIELLTYLFPEDADRAPRYLKRARQALVKYEQLLGPYPYRRLALVENSFRLGEAHPTYILLGPKHFQRDDFERILNHEIVHQWFGCAVSADYDRGNWCEGMAEYFANYLLERENGLGWQSRRRILSSFQTHMEGRREFPLHKFTERVDDNSRAIGYGKGAMVMHMLRQQVGDGLFFEAMRSFFKTNRFAVASWDDLRKSFETKSRQDLSWFFRQWVDEAGQPQVKIDQAKLKKDGDGYLVKLALAQEGLVKRLALPVRFFGPRGSQGFQVNLSRKTESFSFRLDFQPEKVIIDENYDIFRKLAPAENPPTIERLLAARDLQILPPPCGKDRYREAINTFTAQGARLLDNPTEAQLQSTSLLILGRTNPFLKPYLKESGTPQCPVALRVRPHPRSPNLLAASFISADKVTPAVVEKLLEYPFFSSYCLKKENQFSRTLGESQRGIQLKLPHPCNC
ncbi:MAG: M1 family aminopeptidase [Desulfobaccales bacterium]